MQARPRATPRASGASPADASGTSADKSVGTSTEALIARYTAVALAQPGAEFPVQRLVELYRARDGKLDALLAELSRRAEQRGPERLAALLALAAAYKHNNELERAAQTYQQAEVEAPRSALPQLALARLFSDRGERELARQRYERALALVTDAAQREQVLRTLLALALDAGDVDAAKRHHQELIRAQPASFFVRAELGRELLARGLYERAVVELELVVKAGAGDNRVLAPALRDYGRALAHVGRRSEALKQLQRALLLAGSQSGVRREIYEVIVGLYRADNRLAELIAELERKPAADAEEQRLLASLYEETGKLEKAVTRYRAALGADTKDVGTRLKIVHLLEVQGRLKDAIAEYEALTRAAPRNPEYVFRLAEALIQHGDRKRALAALRGLEARSGDDDQVLAALVDFYERVGEKASSLTLLQRLASRGASDPQHLVELGSRYWQEGDKKKALATWQRVRLVSTDRSQGLLTLGELYLEHDLVTEAVQALQEAVRLDPKQLRLRKAYALALERAGTAASNRDAKKLYHDQALELWERILKEEANSPQLAREARQHIVTLWSLAGTLAPRSLHLQRRLAGTPPDLEAGRLLAEAEVRARRYTEAERTLRKIVAAAPGDIESLSRLERVLGLSQRLGEAIAVLELLGRADPKRAREYYQRMAEYAAQLYRDDDAIRYATRAVELSPEDAEGHKKLGEMHRKRGDVPRAVLAFRQAISKNERLFPVYFELAELLLGQGQSEEADVLLRRVVRASPDEELVSRAARLSLQVNLGRGSAEPLERDLLPLSLDNPGRPVYRRLLVELYGTLAYPLLHRVRGADPVEAQNATQQLRALGERAVKPLLDALSDPREAQQETATTVLTYVANQSAGPALFAYATGNASPRLRARAMLALGALRDPALAPRLTELVAPAGKPRAEEADPVLLAAAWSLCKMKAAAARPGLVALATSPAPALRGFGVLGLALLGDRRAAPLIAEVLNATDAGPLPQAAAAFAAGELGLAGTSARLFTFADATDPGLRSAALVALARLRAAGTANKIARLIVAPESGLQAAARAAALVSATGAYRSLGEPLPVPSGDVDLRDVLQGLLPDGYTAADERNALERLTPALELAAAAAVRGSPETARAVAETLSPPEGTPAFPVLLLRSGADPQARAEAERVATRVASTIVPAFIALAEHPTADVRGFAIGFLSRRSEPQAVRAVVVSLRDRDPQLRRAVLALLDTRHAEAAAPVIALSGSESWSERAAAVEALGRLIRQGEPLEAIEALEQRARADATALVREAALAALARSAPARARQTLERARDTDPEPHVRRAAQALLRGEPLAGR